VCWTGRTWLLHISNPPAHMRAKPCEYPSLLVSMNTPLTHLQKHTPPSRRKPSGLSQPTHMAFSMILVTARVSRRCRVWKCDGAHKPIFRVSSMHSASHRVFHRREAIWKELDMLWTLGQVNGDSVKVLCYKRTGKLREACAECAEWGDRCAVNV
jgi:hypothetical protein